MSSFNPFSKLFRPSVPLSTETKVASTGFTVQPVSGATASNVGTVAGMSAGVTAGGVTGASAPTGTGGAVIGGTVGKTIGDVPLTSVGGVATVGAPLAVGGAAAAGITDKFAAGAGLGALAGLAATSGIATRAVSTIVQVGDQPIAPTIVRGGEEVQAPPLNAGKVDDLVSRFVPILRIRIPRGVSQSIAAGTMVAKGTPIDVVLVPVSDIDFSLFDNAHDDLKAKTLDAVLPLLSDPALVPILQKPNAQALTDAEKTTLAQKTQPLGVTVDDNTPGKSTATLFNTLKNAKAFQ